MKGDYLWDGSGEPDPEVQRLERLLGGLKFDRPTPDFSQVPVAPAQARRFSLGWLVSNWRPLAAGLAAAAAVLVVVIGAWWLRAPRPAYDVVSLNGAPRVGRENIRGSGRLRVGQWLETDAVSRAKISVGMIGQVEVEPNTRIGLVRARATEHRLSLARGVMHALIWAPPRLFFVDTPSAVAVDLGCAYTLQVDDRGAGLLRVTSGWVAFERDGRESFVPAGALCATRPGIGPGTPYQADAAPVFQAALAKLDFGPASAEERAEALTALLAQTRRQDTLTLWHLLGRGSESERGRVYERMAEIAPPPAGVTREGVLRGDRHMRDLWWNELGVGDTLNRWRMWKGPWPGQAR